MAALAVFGGISVDVSLSFRDAIAAVFILVPGGAKRNGANASSRPPAIVHVSSARPRKFLRNI